MAQDPYRYFRIEARELSDDLARGVLQLEKGLAPEVVARLLRVAHTLKGAARVVKQRGIAEHAHAIEGLLAPLREQTDAGAPLDRGRIDQLLAEVDSIARLVGEVERPPTDSQAGPGAVASTGTTTPAVAPSAPPAPARTAVSKAAAQAPIMEEARAVKDDVGEMDALLDGIAEASVQLRSIRGASSSLERMRHLAELLVGQIGRLRSADGPRAQDRARSLAEELRDLAERTLGGVTRGADQTERELRQVRDAAERLRLVPASAMLASLERTVRDVAQSLGKRAALSVKGGDVRIDAAVLSLVQGALVQVARNAVAHGIESVDERARAGKPETGGVEIEIARRGSRVAFVCTDDGRGIDVEAVRVAAERAGLLAAGGRAPTAGELLGILTKGGFTTSRTVTETSGRGIGLDVVRDAAERLGGEVSIRTERGRGTTLELVVPVSLSSVDALLVEAGGVPAAIPLDAVRRTLQLAPGDVVRTADSDTILHEGRVIPFVPLARSLGGKVTPSRTERRWSAVVVQGGATLAALGVDRLLGTANLVVQRLPALAPVDAMVSGASLDAEGTPQLVLDAEGLVAAALGEHTRGPLPETSKALPILVIDDSLTTRMLEQSILESAGYEVELANCAEEGLEKAMQRRYALFLVDVEMPGMDGFTFVQKTRLEPLLRDTPAILVSSRNAPEDLKRGAEAGARAYIVKGEFDQGRLLETIRELVRS